MFDFDLDYNNLIGTPNTDFNKIINTTTKNFENKVKDRLTGKLDKELSKAGLPSFADINNIQKNAYERVLKNADFGIGMGIGGYLENNWDVVNNSL